MNLSGPAELLMRPDIVGSVTERGYDAQCPACGSDVLYRYGRSRAGKQRFLCLICGRQFIVGAQRFQLKDRPLCPECGSPMHVYRREQVCLRFRCSDYPECRAFVRIDQKSNDADSKEVK